MDKKTFVIAGGSTGVAKHVVSELIGLGHNVVFGDLDVKNELKEKQLKIKTMKKFFSNLFDDSNSINEKAVIGFASFLIMIIFALTDIVTGAMNKPLLVNEFIYDSFKILTIACFGIASVDKFINKKSQTEDNE